MTQNKQIIDDFHQLYHKTANNWDGNHFAGRKIQQFPGDLFTYAEIIHQFHPEFIIQTGISDGGSLLYFSALKRFFKFYETLIIGVDTKILPETRMDLDGEGVFTFTGKSQNQQIVDQIAAIVRTKPRGLISLDASHARSSVAKELELYIPFLRAENSIIVIEDTNLNGNPVSPDFGPGPNEAAQYWQQTDEGKQWEEFQPWERNLFSFHSWFIKKGEECNA